MIFKRSYAATDKDNRKAAPQTLAKLLGTTLTILNTFVEEKNKK